MVHTSDLKEVVKTEREYLTTRRQTCALENQDGFKPTGLCISGGGIRSATLGLGMMQALMKKDVFKRFDYMSTVSGGGYIGSCLTSLLSHLYLPEDKTNPTSPTMQGQIEIGVTPDHSPFVRLHEHDDYEPAAKTRMGVRHQLHHLRSHGDYLVPIKRLLSRDIQRAVGTVAVGIVHNWTLMLLALTFLAALVHWLCYWVTGNLFTEIFGYRIRVQMDESVTGLSFVTAYLSKWLSSVFFAYTGLFRVAIFDEWHCHVAMIAGGAIWVLVFICVALVNHPMVEWATKAMIINSETEAGATIQDHKERLYIRRFNLLSVVVTATLSLVLAFRFHLVSFFLLPVSVAAGGWLTAVVLVVLVEFINPSRSSTRRSMLGAIRGGCLYGLLLSLAVPMVVILGFAIGNMDRLFWTTLLSFLATFWMTRLQVPSVSNKGAKILAKFRIPMLNGFVGILMLAWFSWVSTALMKYVYPIFLVDYDASLLRLIPWYAGEPWKKTLSCFPGDDSSAVYMVITVSSGLLFIILGFIVNSNRVSLHYFYRDRLADTYLKTNARVRRDAECGAQGMPLVEIRNDEEMKLKDIGDVNGCGPYHIIVAALNLQGSDELNRKNMLSDHFIFSKHWVGSGATGYVRTNVYRKGDTKLARAMTISGAAASSAMGKDWFFAQSFAMTLFNIRLGYWMANPWHYCHRKNEQQEYNPERRWVFWPWYLGKEMAGQCDAKDRLINLSDGGHTGDNLGLFPLLQRRCALIVVCDFEQDQGYEFDSFNNAVRMAYIEENIEVRIDLRRIVPQFIHGIQEFSECSVIEGDIVYPKTASEEAFTGKLVYIKSSLSEPENGQQLPVHVVNYRTTHSDFPHQSTGDQFFDDAQFESYRALGEHLGDQAAGYL